MASVTVRIDDDTKARAAKIAEDFGFDLASITRAFYRQIVRENRIPLNLRYDEPNRESLEALSEARQIAERGTPRFQTAEAMFDSLGM